MKPSSAIAKGLAASFLTKWMVLLFFACNLLLAAALAAPMHAAIAEHVGNSAVGRDLAESFSAAWMTEFSIAKADFLKNFSITIVYAGFLFLGLNTVLSAGAFEVFARGGGAQPGVPGAPAVGATGWYMHAFGRGVGKFFGRFARIAVIASVLYFVAFWFFNGPLERWLRSAFRGVNAEAGHFYLNWLRLALLVLTVLAINLLVEYVKADIVIDDHRSVLAGFGHAAGFVLAHLGRVIFIYAAIGLLTTATSAVYVLFANLMPQHTVATIFIWFVVAQALLWVRWMLRLASWGAAVAYYGAHLPVPRVVEPAASAAAEA